MKTKIPYSSFIIQRRIILIMFVAIGMFACRNDDYPVKPELITGEAQYNAYISVVNNDNRNEKLSGVTFTSATGTIHELGSGIYLFSTNRSGDHTLLLSKEGYSDGSHKISFSPALPGEIITNIATLAMYKTVIDVWRVSYKFSFMDANSVSPLNGVTIDYGKQSESKQKFTVSESTHTFRFDGSATTDPSGTYDFIFSKEGYESIELSVQIPKLKGGESMNLFGTINLMPISTPGQEKYTLDLVIVDAATNVPVENGEVFYSDDMKSGTISFINGKCTITDIAIGIVRLIVQAPNYYATNTAFFLEKAFTDTRLTLGLNMQKVILPEITDGLNGKQQIFSAAEGETMSIPPIDQDLNKNILFSESHVILEPETVITTSVGITLPIVAITTIVNSTLTTTGTYTLIPTFTEDSDGSTVYTGILTGEFSPGGLTFSKPLEWHIVNPFSNLIFDNMHFLYNDGNTWVPTDVIPILNTEGEYVTTIQHFSEYMLSVPFKITKVVARMQKNVIELKNTTSEKLKNPTINTTIINGYTVITDGVQALTEAGFDPSANPEIVAVINNSIANYFVVQPFYTPFPIQYPSGVDVLDISWTFQADLEQQFVQYNLEFQVDGKPITAVVELAGEVRFTNRKLISSDGHHTSLPDVVNGGAGGGSGGNL